MPNKPWKVFERWAAEFIGGERYPANMGDRIDVESESAVFQCKELKVLSLNELTKLAEEMAKIGNEWNKVGGVFVKVRRGGGRKSVPLVILTAPMFDQYFCLRKG